MYKHKICLKQICNIFTAFLVSGIVNGRTVAYFYALDEDWKTCREALAVPEETFQVSGMTIAKLTIGDTTVYASKMGSGVVQSAISAQKLLNVASFDFAISTGPVGALDNSISSGTIYRVSEVVPWQRLSSFYYSAPDTISVLTPIDPPGDWSTLLMHLETIRVASGELFVASDSFRDELRWKTKSNAIDMNLFGLLMALEQSKVPSINLRSVSDRADSNATLDFKQFLKEYNGELGIMVANILRNLPSDPTNPDNYPELRNLFNDSE